MHFILIRENFKKDSKIRATWHIPRMGEMGRQNESCVTGEEDSLLRSEPVTPPLETFLPVDKEISYLM